MASDRIAVVTPYYKEPIAVLRKCHESVLIQNEPVDHFMVADGFPLAEIDAWNVKHVKLPFANADNGNTPRGIGSILARAAGYNFITYLDADNWYHPGHIIYMLNRIEATKYDVATCLRTFHELDGRPMNISEPAEDALKHVDTSCIFLTRSAFDLIDIWTSMPKMLSPICDKVFYAGIIHRRHSVSSTRERTVAFRTQYASHYRDAGRPIPEGCNNNEKMNAALSYLTTRQGVTETVRALGFWPLSYLQV